ncbi:protein phosphatase 2C-related protein [Heterostelium album PN500]|uniref:Protein phosphatase 2C-related protein n=1 Tax=Heterostelium pallidum (strain ATCC 26659 / Pp 5 / PN500) TaxID=670386 RepID=D3BCK7_HETP5|nr:protein phosphatase 2C-related protein [Heterostelium album PN500]EFA80649.1 protein phosphatase 2C-related protein [Heterostelium album PN500]|eukprot:XP_020432769.1 protein phosphatase 2C-related protein [Heterostelium album PN500]
MSTQTSPQSMIVLQYDQLPHYRVANLKSSTHSIQVDGDTDEPFLSTRSISTYPLLPGGEKDGDPIADKLFVQVHRNRAILAVADGCNWGKRPALAASHAIAAFANYFNQRQSEILTLQDAGHFLLRAFCEAHNKIVEGKNDIWEAGTTTLLGGLVLELEDDSGVPKWGFLCASVGDCKAFLVSLKRREATDVTNGNRCNLNDTRDPGGRLGPYVGQGYPDLRNLKFSQNKKQPNDYREYPGKMDHTTCVTFQIGRSK